MHKYNILYYYIYEEIYIYINNCSQNNLKNKKNKKFKFKF